MILVELFAESAIYQLFSDVFVLDAACSVISSGSFRALLAKYFSMQTNAAFHKWKL